MSFKNVDIVNYRLAGTGVQLAPIGRGYGFRLEDGGFVRLSNFTTKKASELTVEELVGFASKVAAGVCVEEDKISGRNEPKTYSIETKEIGTGWNDSGYRFRIVCSDGRASGWAPYDRACFIDNTAALTPYFHGSGDVQMFTLAEAMGHIAIGEAFDVKVAESENDGLTESAVADE